MLTINGIANTAQIINAPCQRLATYVGLFWMIRPSICVPIKYGEVATLAHHENTYTVSDRIYILKKAFCRLILSYGQWKRPFFRQHFDLPHLVKKLKNRELSHMSNDTEPQQWGSYTDDRHGRKFTPAKVPGRGTRQWPTSGRRQSRQGLHSPTPRTNWHRSLPRMPAMSPQTQAWEGNLDISGRPESVCTDFENLDSWDEESLQDTSRRGFGRCPFAPEGIA
ncbi:hypothetical protein T310_3461 [Rasamsonia emersonii CBS 393.64]|uniref:Uncharacterized protein n=1 Tax=Rasamsonia emersonii (strain ATCC 16479 / CBS 393.64 / IMI 116815) TaxID=1408163 RepID=A0A0F4YY03_RASE3|nr:hypothetical protein T310_3461 [Rasamsonia emersonii CBS 393.64]KKA22518.1 hypothetical protein T310_3461 [Rasamsonia emersonii CBS 393.64]